MEASPPRFYALHLTVGAVPLDPDESHHALSSLRLRPGAPVELFDGRGRAARGVLEATTGKRERTAIVRVDQLADGAPPPPPLTLYVAGCKGPRLSWLVEKTTELGATRLAFTEFDRSVVRVSAGHAEKLTRVAIAAAKQSGRMWLPTITTGTAIGDLRPDADHLVVAHPTPGGPSLSEWLAATAPTGLTVVIGPEGGLTDEELERLEAVPAATVRLGRHTLRIETAAVAVAAAWALHSDTPAT